MFNFKGFALLLERTPHPFAEFLMSVKVMQGDSVLHGIKPSILTTNTRVPNRSRLRVSIPPTRSCYVTLYRIEDSTHTLEGNKLKLRRT